MKNKEIAALSDQELLDKITEEKAGLNKMKLNHAVSPVENPSKIYTTRKTIAKLMTESTKRKNTANASNK
jgi:large subunit ribosomal protein L29